MLDKQWEKAEWIFEPDGALCDIYVQNTDLNHWLHVIDWLNENYTLIYGPVEEGEPTNQIEPEYITQYLCGHTDEGKSVSIALEDITINCHFFSVDEIEFDLAPEEISTKEAFKKLLDFMQGLSQITEKDVILTPENTIHFPLVIIKAPKQNVSIISFQEHQRHLAQYTASRPVKMTLRSLLMRPLFNSIPYIKNVTIKRWLVDAVIHLSGATKPYKADREQSLYYSENEQADQDENVGK
jgi:hypothetical protein